MEDLVKDYTEYLKLDVCNGFQIVQDVVDNMLTRLEELTSVLQIIKTKNNECNTSITQDLRRYRSEISVLTKKILSLYDIVLTLHNNVEILEKQVDKAESDFGIHNDNKLKSLFKPFFKLSKDVTPNSIIVMPEKYNFESVLSRFEENES